MAIYLRSFGSLKPKSTLVDDQVYQQESTAQLALIHYKDFTDLLHDWKLMDYQQRSSDLDIHDYRIWIRHLQVAPLVWLDGDGMRRFSMSVIMNMIV